MEFCGIGPIENSKEICSLAFSHWNKVHIFYELWPKFPISQGLAILTKEKNLKKIICLFTKNLAHHHNQNPIIALNLEVFARRFYIP
jgi:hypothetical protein